MGLIHPLDLGAWQRWQDSRHRAVHTLRRAREVWRPSTEPSFWIARGPGAETHPDALFVLDSPNATSRHAVLDPALRRGRQSAVVTSFDPAALLPEAWSAEPLPTTAIPELVMSTRAVVSMAHYLPLGSRVWDAARRNEVPYATVQHGLLTPFAPPAPTYGTLLTWSEEDAAFWLSGRTDLETTVVGSQLLFAAGLSRAPHVSRFDRPLFLGQLHGAELPRRTLSHVSRAFCHQTGSWYRPHPAETDLWSRTQHRLWERSGVVLDRRPTPLSSLDEPVVSIFSTGVLEAAARGIPAWVWFPHPPNWLEEFWERYGMHPWGQTPTPPPVVPASTPSDAVVVWVDGHTGPRSPV